MSTKSNNDWLRRIARKDSNKPQSSATSGTDKNVNADWRKKVNDLIRSKGK